MDNKIVVPAATFLLISNLIIVSLIESVGIHWEITEGIIPGILLWLGVLGLYKILSFFIKNAVSVLAITIFSIYTVFQFSIILVKMNIISALLTLFIVIAIGIFLCLRSEKISKIFLQTLEWLLFLNSLYLLPILIINGVVQRYDVSSLPKIQDYYENKNCKKNDNSLPDIFFILLDGYASNDTLKTEFNFDNGEFLNFLKGNRFYVAEKSKSYYSQTMLSISSTLNLNYFQDDVRLPHTKFADRTPAANYFLRPRITKYLYKKGYDLLKLSSAYNLDYTFDSDVTDIRTDSLEHRVGTTLINRTPFYQILNLLFGEDHKYFNLYLKHYHTIINQHKILRSIIEENVSFEPKFVYVHFLQPHPAFVFDDSGNFANYAHTMPFRYSDGIYDIYNHLYPDGWNHFYRSAYIKQLRYLNSEIKKTIKAMLTKKSERPKIIIIQGDHGSRMEMDFNNVNNTNFYESFGILNAVYFSDGDYSSLTQDISPANVMRMIMNKYFGFDLKKLKNRQWYSTWTRPYAFIEVTDKLH